MKKKIDILLAVYNGEKYLLEQLQSIFDQSYEDFNLILRDDCSSDSSVSVIQKFSSQYPGKIRLIEGKTNLGALGNFSELMKKSQANYIMFSDNDDVWKKNKIRDCMELMKINELRHGDETPLLIHTDLSVVDQYLNNLGDSFWQYSRLNPNTAQALNRLLVQNVITGCTMLINRKLLQLAAPIPKEAIMHDWWIGLVACALGKIDVLKQSTIYYRQHSNNVIGAKNWGKLSTYLNAFKKISKKAGRQLLHKQLKKTIQQSSLLLDRYENQLSPKKREILKHYVALGKSNPLLKRYLFIRHRFFKNTFLKNVGMFYFL